LRKFFHTKPTGEFCFQVCTNGYLSVEQLYSNPKPPTDTDSFDNKIIISPFYAEIQPLSMPNVTYRSYDIINDHPFTTQQEEEIELIEYIIQNFSKHKAFKVKFVVIATWNSVQPFQIETYTVGSVRKDSHRMLAFVNIIF